MKDKKELQRIIENITSTYNCFENDRCCNKTESEETEAELDEIIQFINNQDKQLQACQEQVTTKTDEFGNKYLEWEKTFLENTALKQQLDNKETELESADRKGYEEFQRAEFFRQRLDTAVEALITTESIIRDYLKPCINDGRKHFESIIKGKLKELETVNKTALDSINEK